MKINVKQLVETIKAAENGVKPSWMRDSEWIYARSEAMTKLYSARAHLRGRLHVRRQRLTGLEHSAWYCGEGGGPGVSTAIVARDLEWQGRFVAGVLENFEENMADPASGTVI